MDDFELISKGDTIPVFAWKLKDGQRNWNLYDLADRLRMRGWLVPAYPMPDDIAEMVVQRIVVRSDFSKDLASYLLTAIREEVAYLDSLTTPLPSEAKKQSFAH